MNAEPLALLWEATLAGSAALLLVLALRRPVRARLGASAAYALWLCVPVALLAVLLPRGADVPLVLPVAWQMAPVAVVAATPEPQAGWHWREWLFASWLAGMLASMAVLGWQQRRFRRGLGALRRRDDGLYQSTSATSGLPAVAGVLRPRILLPVDFEQRYTAQEQSLVIAHEHLHVRCGDLAANALAALLACLFWFNPLLHWALRRFRFDQELACDERVIARHPQARRSYGEAMLKTQFDPSPLPLGCHWQARHPLKERIDMLKRPTPSPLQWLFSVLLALAVTAATGYVAWATQPSTGPGRPPAPGAEADKPYYAVEVRMEVDGQSRTFSLREYAGRSFGFRQDADGAIPPWGAELMLLPVEDPAQVWIDTTIQVDGKQVSNPRMVVALGKAGTVRVSLPDGGPVITLDFTVQRMQKDAVSADGNRPQAQPPADEGHVSAQAANSPLPYNRWPPPSYPVEAARQGVSGGVVLVVTVGADGSVRDVQVEKSTPEGVFEAAAVEAARKWKFTPETRDGQPVEGGRVRVPITFETEAQPDANAAKG